jgi:HEAT repeat protein
MRYSAAMFVALILLALLALVPGHAQDISPSADVRGDLARIDTYKTDAEKQDERIPLMRNLAAVGGSDVAVKFVSLLNDEFLHVREEAEDLLLALKGSGVNEALVKQGLGAKENDICRRAALILGARKCEEAIVPLTAILRGQRDSEVRVACALALEKIGSEKALRVLSDGLSVRGPTGGACAAALGRLGKTEEAARIERLLHDKDGLCVVGAADGLALLGPDAWVKNLCGAADHKDQRARIAVAQALSKVSAEVAPQTQTTFAALLKDDDWRVRRRSIEALVDLWHPMCVELLLARLPLEKSSLRYDLVHALEDLTGERKGYAADGWTFYWNQVGKQRGVGGKVKRPIGGWLRMPSTALVQEGGEGTTVLFEVPVLAQDSCFVIQTTGTMNGLVAGGARTRFVVARDEMRRTLAGLGKDTGFQVLTYRYVSNFPPFAQRQAAFEKGVQPVTAENIKAAEEWLAKRDVFGLCAWFENVASALEDPKVRAVYFVNDGAFQRGISTKLSRIKELYLQATRFQPISFVSIGLDMGYQHTLDMQAFTESIGGKFQLAKFN